MKESPSHALTPIAAYSLSEYTMLRLFFTICILTLGFQFVTTSSFAQHTKLLDFDTPTSGRNAKGNLIFDGTFLYGMAVAGGANDAGTIFKIKPDGSGYTKLMDFNGTSTGHYPLSSLFSDGTFLYGTTSAGGSFGIGTIFKVRLDGTGFTKLLDFNGIATGRAPESTFVSDGTFLYGMTPTGGANFDGIIFKIRPDGTGFVKLMDFEAATSGREPKGDLIFDGTFLYGMTLGGGANNMGVVFKIRPDGTGFTKLLDFAGTANGSYPFGSLISDGVFLYGMTSSGGANDLGTVFKIKPDGTGFVKLRDFAGTFNGNDGNDPHGSLTFDGTFLYGMTGAGGANGVGTLFKIRPNGTEYVKLLDFEVSIGAYPKSSLIIVGGILYGMTDYGGTIGAGTVFKYALTLIAITTQPADYSTCAGGMGTFTTVATGTTNIKYQWQFASTSTGPYTDIANGGGYSNATASTLSVNTSGNFGAGFYRCKISGNADIDRFSNTATLTVNNIPTAPNTIGAAGCAPTTVNLTASGGTNGQYRWYTTAVGGTPVTGQVNSSYTTPVISAPTTYYVAINNGSCESLRAAVVADVKICDGNLPPSIAPTSTTTQIEGKVTLNLAALISDPDDNLDLSTLKIITQPESNAFASIDSENNLIIDYKGLAFSGQDHLTIEVCDLMGSCVQRELTIEVEGDIIIYNAVSPNGDNKNDTWIIKNIDLLEDTKLNHVVIFNRWGDAVFETDNYDNVNQLFNGRNKNGNELPTGTYFYEIDFTSGRKSLSGFISLKR